MRSLALALTFAIATFASAEVHKVNHIRASRMLALLTGSTKPGARVKKIEVTLPSGETLIPAGIHNLVADDAAGTITSDGPQQSSRELGRIIAEFDVAPRLVETNVSIHSKADKYDSATKTLISNYATWSLEDGTTQVRLSLMPRINADGTITVSVKLGGMATATQMVLRLKPNEKYQFHLDEDGIVLPALQDGVKTSWSDAFPGSALKASSTYIDVTISFAMIEDDQKDAVAKVQKH